MTLSHRFTLAVLALLAAAGVTLGAAWIGYQSARADTPHYVVDATEPTGIHSGHPYRDTLIAQADTAQPDAGLASAPAADATAADRLHDPISAPGASWDDLKAAKKVGWPLAVFAGLVLLCKLLARAKSVGALAWLGKGKTAVVVGALGALGAACYNAAADGGAWTATLMAGLMGLAHYLDAGKADG